VYVCVEVEVGGMGGRGVGMFHQIVGKLWDTEYALVFVC